MGMRIEVFSGFAQHRSRNATTFVPLSVAVRGDFCNDSFYPRLDYGARTRCANGPPKNIESRAFSALTSNQKRIHFRMNYHLIFKIAIL
jgi:hypothetical protein